ncbi:MAG: hypothetical protein JW837_17045 [Sedimentisphaerales bacterium]|nr:hypothetical protein [Sedimentisphaerales bacterium]
MAKIIFTHTELLSILLSNELLPDKIQHPKIEDQKIRFTVETGLPILPLVPASLRFISFADNNAIFELTVVNSALNKTIGRLNLLSKLDVPDYVRIDFPKISVDVNELLRRRNIRGVQIKDIFFDNGEFTIITSGS